MDNWIFKYHEAIQKKEVIVGVWVRLSFEILTTGLLNGEWEFNEKKANKAIKFIENFCHHSEGRSDLLHLELWQKAIVSAIFGVMDKTTGYRQFREVFIIVARKNGKTLFAAAIAAYMTYVDGEYGAKVYFLAPKLDQADLVYDAFYQIVQSDDELDSITKKRRSDIYIKAFNTSVKKIAFNSKKSDGFNPQLVVNDEMEAWPGDQGLKQYEVMTSALGARKQPLIISIATAGYVNDGIFDELFKRATAFLKGNSREKRLLPFIYMIDDIEKWDSIEELKKSNPNLGVSVSAEYYLEQIEIARNSISKKVEFMTKFCNIKQNSAVAWLDYWDVMKCVHEEKPLSLEDFKGCYCVGGIDLSRTTDLTAASIVIRKTYLSKIARYCELGFRVVPDFKGKKMTFETYKGIDRTTKQGTKPRVIFSESYNNLNRAKHTYSDETAKTKIVIGGAGDGADRIYVTVGGGTGFDLREEFLDAKDINKDDFSTNAEYLEALRIRGEQYKAENAVIENIEAEVEAEVNFIYGTDYDLGDIVTVEKAKWNKVLNLRITELCEVYEYGGMYVVPTFGDALPTTINWDN